MSIAIPSALKAEHEELHADLAAASRSGGRTGEAARTVVKLMHPHFIAEEAFALPPLGLLGQLVAGDAVSHSAEAVEMSDRLRSELPRMLDEHRAIVAALDGLERAANDEHKPEIADFAHRLIQHASMEEQVMYPAALLVGAHIKRVEPRAMPEGTHAAVHFDLVGELDRMRGAQAAGTTHLAKTLVRSPSLRIVLITMDAGAHIPEHRAEGAITLQVIDGRIGLHHSGGAVELAPGQLATFDRGVPHSVDASERSGFLLTIAWTGHHRPT